MDLTIQVIYCWMLERAFPAKCKILWSRDANQQPKQTALQTYNVRTALQRMPYKAKEFQQPYIECLTAKEFQQPYIDCFTKRKSSSSHIDCRTKWKNSNCRIEIDCLTILKFSRWYLLIKVSFFSKCVRNSNSPRQNLKTVHQF